MTEDGDEIVRGGRGSKHGPGNKLLAVLLECSELAGGAASL